MVNQQRDEPTEREEIDLTDSDERALDHAWATITEEDITASIRWLNSLPPARKPTPPPTMQHNPL